MRMPGTTTLNRTDRGPKPRVVLADDHPRVLQSVRALLADDFEIVAAVSDGRQALAASLNLDPDLVVLDITMPELDGFRTAQELNRSGSRARIVFLTMHDADEYVTAGVGAGAHGYVVKTRIHSDLPSAIDHALAGRRFLPSLTSVSAATDADHAHVAHFHAGERGRLDDASLFLRAALDRGDAVAVIATDASRVGLAERLGGHGRDVAEAARQGRYLVYDTKESMSKILRNGRPDAGLVEAFIGGLERSRLSVAGAERLTVLGDMAFELFRAGNVEGALQQEQIWNDLTRSLPFVTLCSYPADCFHGEEGTKAFPQLCAAHRVVCHG